MLLIGMFAVVWTNLPTELLSLWGTIIRNTRQRKPGNTFWCVVAIVKGFGDFAIHILLEVKNTATTSRLPDSEAAPPQMLAMYCIYRGAEIASIGQYTCSQTTTEMCRVVEVIRKRGLSKSAPPSLTHKPVWNETKATKQMLRSGLQASKQTSDEMIYEIFEFLRKIDATTETSVPNKDK